MECGGGGAAGDGDCVRERGFGEVRGAAGKGREQGDETKRSIVINKMATGAAIGKGAAKRGRKAAMFDGGGDGGSAT